MKSTKSEISKEFSILRKYGYKVITFNSQSKLSSAMKDFVDHVIFNGNNIYFVEVKIGKDKLSDGQKDTAEKLLNIAFNNSGVRYHLITSLEQAKILVDNLLKIK